MITSLKETGLTLKGLVESVRPLDGEKAFVIGPSGESLFSLKGILNQVARVAGRLQQDGVRKGDRVAILLSNRADEFIAAFAVAWLGAVFVHISHKNKEAQLLHILIDSEPMMAIIDRSRMSTCLKSLGGLRIVDWHENIISEGTIVLADPRPDDLAALVYTSGSTGMPRGVMVTHRNYVEATSRVANYLENTSSDRVMAILPINAPWGLLQWSTMLLCGGSVVLTPEYAPAEALVTSLFDTGVNGLAAMPLTWIHLVDWAVAHKRTLPNLRYLTCSGGVLPDRILEAMPLVFPNARIFLTYGLTEAFRTTVVLPEWYASKRGSLGRPCDGVTIDVVREDGSLARDNEPGELVHRGSCVTHGYWRHEEETKFAFRGCQSDKPSAGSNRAHFSGDIVRRDSEGFLWFISRSDAMIKTGGFRVSPDEVVAASLRSNLVKQAFAWGEPCPILGQTIALAVEATAPTCTQDALLQLFHQTLPTYARPTRIKIWLTAFPLTPNGKIDLQEVIRQSCP